MKQLIIAFDELNRVEKIIKTTSSYKLKNDMRKYRNRLLKDIQEYCMLKNFNYQDVKKELTNDK